MSKDLIIFPNPQMDVQPKGKVCDYHCEQGCEMDCLHKFIVKGYCKAEHDKVGEGLYH
jgi:hypothetical protein